MGGAPGMGYGRITMGDSREWGSWQGFWRDCLG